MPKRPPVITTTDLGSMRFQVNEALSELSDYVEEICGIDKKQFKSQNDINLNNFKIINLEAPAKGSDGVNKDYVDDAIDDLTDYVNIVALNNSGTAVSSSQTISGATTLSILDYAEQFITITASAGSTVVGLTAISTGSVVTLYAADDNMTIVHSSSLVLKGADNLPMNTGDMITLIRTKTTWRERSRTLF